MPNPLGTPSELPDGAPPTLDQHRRWAQDASRNWTDDPLGQHRRTRPAPRTAIPSADILRRTNTPVAGERTPDEAAFIDEANERFGTKGQPK